MNIRDVEILHTVGGVMQDPVGKQGILYMHWPNLRINRINLFC